MCRSAELTRGRDVLRFLLKRLEPDRQFELVRCIVDMVSWGDLFRCIPEQGASLFSPTRLPYNHAQAHLLSIVSDSLLFLSQESIVDWCSGEPG